MSQIIKPEVSHNLEQITSLITKYRDERDWKQFHSIAQMLLALFTEVAELSEHFQWQSEEQLKDRLIDKKSQIADELADVLYWVLLIAHDCNIDIQTALLEKMQKNIEKYPVNLVKGKNKKYTEYK